MRHITLLRRRHAVITLRFFTMPDFSRVMPCCRHAITMNERYITLCHEVSMSFFTSCLFLAFHGAFDKMVFCFRFSPRDMMLLI